MSITLPQSLTQLTVPELKDLSSHLPGSDLAGRKDELVSRLGSALLGLGLKTIWLCLNETQQIAVAEAAHHPQGEFSSQRFRAKYQRSPAFDLPGVNSSGYGSKRSALCLFIHYSQEEKRYFVPTDLRARLLEFVPPPASVGLESTQTLPDTEGLITRLTEREALQEVVVMLRTLEQTRVTVGEKTALPSSATLSLLSQKLVGGDFYPEHEKKGPWSQTSGPIKAFAWPMLLQAGGLAARTGGRLTLSPAGVKALTKPPFEVLRGLWQKWLKTTLLDEFSRIDTIKGQNSKGRVMSAVAPRRDAIEEALLDCPVGRWVRFDDFSRFMRACDCTFVVAHDPWKLFIGERQYGSLGYDGSHGWNILQDRYIAALLFEYAASLGIIDLAYFDPAEGNDDFRSLWGADDLSFLSRYDGLESFRITALGAYVLGLAPAYEPQTMPSNLMLSVMPSLQLHLKTGSPSPEELLLLDCWAEPVQAGSWLLDREKALIAIEKGYDITELQRFLVDHDELPLPELVESFIRRCARDGRALKTGASAVLVECRDIDVADLVSQHPETGPLCLRAGPKTLVVRNDKLEKFRERVRIVGFGLVA
jgi:hypothetical protein